MLSNSTYIPYLKLQEPWLFSYYSD